MNKSVWQFAAMLLAVKLLAIVLAIVWSEAAHACGDNVTPDETPDISWPENLS